MEKKACYIVIGMGMIFLGLLILFYSLMPSSVTVQRPTEDSISAISETSKINATNNSDKTDISTSTEATVTYPINLNTATAKDLSDNISGIGDVLAARIIEYRENHGPFSSVDELTNVSGIGEKKLAAIKEYLTAE